MKTTIALLIGILLAVCALVDAADQKTDNARSDIVTPIVPALPDSDSAVVAQVTTSALAGDWHQVLKLTEWVEIANASPVIRLVRGHACLALNRNNEATLLFFATRDPRQLAAYESWARESVSQNAENAYASYFAGDAAARLGNFEEAERKFNEAIQSRPDFALAYNARGVANAAQDKTDRAKEDFRRAAVLTENRLADANSNMGYLWIQRKANEEWAKRAFTMALDVSPEFALAQHGRGCIELIQRNPQAAAADLSASNEKGIMFVGLLVENEVRFAARETGSTEEALVSQLQEPGTTLKGNVTRASSEAGLRDDANKHFEQASRFDRMGLGGLGDIERNKGYLAARELHTNFGAESLGNIERQDQLRKAVDTRSSPEARRTGAILDEIGKGVGRVAETLTRGGYSGGLHGEVIETARAYDNTALENMRRSLPRPTMPQTNDLERSRGANGVDFAVNSDRGDWPFNPIYALAYPLAEGEPR